MALQDLLDLNVKRQKIGLSEERIDAIKPYLRDYIAFWREYPDLFVDFLVRGTRTEVKEGEFHFYFYQRVFLRCVMRHQYVYAVFPRAYSKSFLSVMALMIRCILYPRANLFVTSGGKEQAAGILKDKVQEICTLIPAFESNTTLSPIVILPSVGVSRPAIILRMVVLPQPEGPSNVMNELFGIFRLTLSTPKNFPQRFVIFSKMISGMFTFLLCHCRGLRLSAY